MLSRSLGSGPRNVTKPCTLCDGNLRAIPYRTWSLSIRMQGNRRGAMSSGLRCECALVHARCHCPRTQSPGAA
eukprot:1836400-Pleurochrysis_carterae.AAC.1